VQSARFTYCVLYSRKAGRSIILSTRDTLQTTSRFPHTATQTASDFFIVHYTNPFHTVKCAKLIHCHKALTLGSMSASGSAPDSTVAVPVPVPVTGASTQTVCDHVMDPSGDVILTLSDWAAPVRPWRLFWDMSDEDLNEGSNEGDDEEASASDSEEGSDDDGSEADGEESGESGPARKKRRVGDEEAQSDNPDHPVTFRLSSRHLMQASPFFKAALAGSCSEANATNGEFQITAEGWNVDALVVVMNAIHGRHFSVPELAGIGLLARIATIVDYYGCHEALHPHSARWIEKLQARYRDIGFPQSMAMATLCAGVVFRDANMFNQAVETILWNGRGDLEAPPEFPIAAIVGKFGISSSRRASTDQNNQPERVDGRRKEVISEVARKLDECRRKYTQGLSSGCRRACTHMIVGTLVEMMDQHILDPHTLDECFSDNSLRLVYEDVRRIQFQKWYTEDGPHVLSRKCLSGKSKRDFISDLVAAAEDKSLRRGLQLSDFPRPNTWNARQG